MDDDDGASTLFSINQSSRRTSGTTLRPVYSINQTTSTLKFGPCPFLRLPLELRNKIYRYILISRLDCTSHPRLWRPVGVDGGVSKIGYFEKDSVIPLLLVCRRVHDEGAAVLYGENTFAFHISGLAEGPISFLEWLSERYVRLLRRVYVRTGYAVETYGSDREPVPSYNNNNNSSRDVPPPREDEMQVEYSRDLTVSAALMKQAWPSGYGVVVDREETVVYEGRNDGDVCRSGNGRGRGVDWPASGFHLWKMMVVVDGDGEVERREFKRIEWERTRGMPGEGKGKGQGGERWRLV